MGISFQLVSVGDTAGVSTDFGVGWRVLVEMPVPVGGKLVAVAMACSEGLQLETKKPIKNILIAMVRCLFLTFLLLS